MIRILNYFKGLWKKPKSAKQARREKQVAAIIAEFELAHEKPEGFENEL